MEYLKRTDFVHVKPDDLGTSAVAKGFTDPIEVRIVPGSEQTEEEDKQTSIFSAENDKRESKGLGVATGTNILSKHLQNMMGDAPFCNGCGHTTVRNGACYKCLNCGNSMGCS